VGWVTDFHFSLFTSHFSIPLHSDVEKKIMKVPCSYMPYPNSRISAFVIIFLICLTAVPVSVSSSETRAYEIKAAFLYNFVKFVEWPESLMKQSRGIITVGIMGTGDFGNSFDVIAGRSVKDMKLSVRYFEKAEDIRACHLLFVSDSEKNRLRDILESVRGYPVLTVGDAEDFSTLGGIIRFYTENNKVRFEINISAASKADLKISAKLLEVAKIAK